MPSEKFHIAIFASGNGSNAEEIIKYFKDHPLVRVDVLLTNNPDAFVIKRAEKLGIPAFTFTREDFKNGHFISELLSKHQVTHVVLAGFLWLIPEYLIKNYANRIINIHPALLPKFGGKGMYGSKVHEAVKSSG